MTHELSAAYQQRFGGIARLYGQSALHALAQGHFAVIGLGGVGTWTAEALARSGVGNITLIEMDEVCVTNTNRQLHALSSTIGHSKNKIIAARLREINPEINLNCIEDFLDADNMTAYIGKQYDVIIDATDGAHIKARLAAYCSALKVRLIIVGSSGGKRNPLLIEIADLARTSGDPMLAKVRTQLFRHHNFARDRNRKFSIDAVFSPEQMVYPKPDGSVCMDKQYLEDGVKLDCAGGFGSSVMVTGAFGFAAANKAIERYLSKL
jgi:tRNA threonylcarbamoyladenosine dehydratase